MECCWKDEVKGEVCQTCFYGPNGYLTKCGEVEIQMIGSLTGGDAPAFTEQQEQQQLACVDSTSPDPSTGLCADGTQPQSLDG